MHTDFQFSQPQVASADMVYAQIKEKIFSWAYEPGCQLSEQKVSMELGVSRTPVREAFIRLINDNLLEAKPYRGTYVSKIDLAQVEESRFIRIHLEVAVAMEACDLEIADYILEAEQNIQKQREAIQERDFARCMELDNAFHAALFLACKKQLTLQVVSSVNSHYQRLRRILTDKPGLPDEHAQILAQLKKRDKQAVAEIIRHHLSNITTEALEVKQRHPEFFVEKEG